MLKILQVRFKQYVNSPVFAQKGLFVGEKAQLSFYSVFYSFFLINLFICSEFCHTLEFKEHM